MPTGFYWRAPSREEYFVSVEDVTPQPGRPKVVPVKAEVRFYQDDKIIYSAELPNPKSVEDLTEEDLLRIYNASSLGEDDEDERS